MFYRFLLVVSFILLTWRLRWKIKKNPEAAALLKEEDFAVQLKTEDQTFSRYLYVQTGIFNNAREFHSQPNFSVSFESPAKMYKILRAIRKESAYILTAIQEKEIIFEGDFSLLQRLMALREKLQDQ